ncbi:unnamed protein product [Penicillium olsonii]|nr:unnamed protein product [Penicillium olsonii]
MQLGKDYCIATRCNSSTPLLRATPRSWKAFTPFDKSRGLVSLNTHRPRKCSPFWEHKWQSGATGQSYLVFPIGRFIV